LCSLGDEISLLTQSAPSATSFEPVGGRALSDYDFCKDSKSSGRKGSEGTVLTSSLCDSAEQGSVKVSKMRRATTRTRIQISVKVRT
jgi:hypothetical protein